MWFENKNYSKNEKGPTVKGPTVKGPTVRSVQNTYEKLNSNAELFLLLKYSSSIKKWSQVQQAKKKL